MARIKSHGGVALVELLIVLAIWGTLGATGLWAGFRVVKTIESEIAAYQICGLLSLCRIHALAYRTDQWIWVSGGTVQSTLGTKIPTLSNVTINGSGKLGFTDSGTAKYAGTAVISANKQTISIPVAVGLAKPVIRK